MLDVTEFDSNENDEPVSKMFWKLLILNSELLPRKQNAFVECEKVFREVEEIIVLFSTKDQFNIDGVLSPQKHTQIVRTIKLNETT